MVPREPLSCPSQPSVLVLFILLILFVCFFLAVVAREKDGEGIVRKFGMDMYTLLYFKWRRTKTYCVARETLLNVMWRPGWKGSLGENGYMYMYQ